MRGALLLAQEEGGGDALIDVVPGLMIWTIITFLIVLFVLRRLAFGRIQGLIDERRERIRQALDEADKAREEARQLRELTRQEREEAKAERDKILEETRRQVHEQSRRARAEADADLHRRLEENQRALEAENRKFREQIRRDVVELTLLASEKVTRKTLTDADQRRLIDETVKEIDVARIASDGER
ncbi:MAG: F0F1 ATP synthase subunit B [Actinomycetota bacterium]|jgi:F-type H+-transporting ATPase subunit b|nr:F0F1 ATP synthase subunit B [Actinomycetota bacterium]